VTGLAPRRVSVSPHLLHALVELAFVDIFVATVAVQHLPTIDEILGLELGRFFVAVCARHRHMAARQYKPGLLVLGQGEGGRRVPLQVVALVAGVEIRRRGKLS